MSASDPRVVIIGGGFAGLEAARAFGGAAMRVTILDRHNYHLFQPLLYQVATAALSPGDVASPIRWILRHQQNVEVLLANVKGIDPIANQVDVEPGGPVPYDYLIVCAGATHAYFGHPEWADRAPGLKTLDDALEMRRRVLLAFEAAERASDPQEQRRLLTFVIVGGGPTGVELSGALAEIARQSLRHDFRHIRPESARIILVEGGPDILPAFAPPLRVAAEPTLQVPGRPNVFVAGDLCALAQDGAPLPGVAQVAMQEGAHAAQNVLRAVRGEPLTPFRYKDYGTMATIGRGSAIADIHGVKVAGFFAWLIWIFLHIFWLIGFRNRLAVMGEWAWAYLTFQRRIRLITGERL